MLVIDCIGIQLQLYYNEQSFECGVPCICISKVPVYALGINQGLWVGIVLCVHSMIHDVDYPSHR